MPPTRTTLGKIINISFTVKSTGTSHGKSNDGDSTPESYLLDEMKGFGNFQQYVLVPKEEIVKLQDWDLSPM